MTDYRFTSDWFSNHAQIWPQIIKTLGAPPKKIVEVGSYEGRSMVWLAEHAAPDAMIYCIDHWQGGREHEGTDMAAVEARFDHNVREVKARYPEMLVVPLKGDSVDMLCDLVTGHKGTFDLIYLDGSHEASDVMADLICSSGTRRSRRCWCPRLRSMPSSIASTASSRYSTIPRYINCFCARWRDERDGRAGGASCFPKVRWTGT